jgi:nucleotide-binding universal stress UspA family protein
MSDGTLIVISAKMQPAAELCMYKSHDMITLNTQKVLIPVDFSATSLIAIRHGAFLAKKNKGELYIVHVIRRRELTNTSHPTAELRQLVTEKSDMLERTRELACEVRKHYNIPVHALVTSGKCAKSIVKTAERINAGLIVMGTRGEESTSSLFFGSNALRVIARANIPVITIRTGTSKVGYSRILLPINSSEHSRQKVNSALQVAKMFAASVKILGILGTGEEAYRYKLEVILRQIRKMAESSQLFASSEIVTSDDPAEFTMAYAHKTGSDIIISMTDENTGASRIVAGSFDEQLVEQSPVPVMSIQPEIHEENYAPIVIGGMW